MKILKTSIVQLAMLLIVLCNFSCKHQYKKEHAAYEVISRVLGKKGVERFKLAIDTTSKKTYNIHVENNQVHVSASDQVALCRGVYDYLKKECGSMVCWSGSNIQIPAELEDYSSTTTSHFKYRYYFNVVTHGYSTVYWDWSRWEKELDWMAIHGLNMPLLPGAHEAILKRVFEKLGLNETQIKSYFTGPAHFPWNRMGNISGWDGPVPDSYYKKQIQLNHKVLKRARDLDMEPIVPAFAGFVPSAIQDLFPQEKVRELAWGGFKEDYHAYILEPGSDLFIRIGKMYIQEWEKEFGKSNFYLADSFNEMDVPLSSDSITALNELAGYGESVYQSIKQANPDATWVMQGWTFPYQYKDGKLFWTPERLQAMLSRIPDDKLLILDLANEYNRLWWKVEPCWKTYKGFFGKQWLYSFIPNMGGKTAFNGRLDLYASMPFEALQYEHKGNLVGYGFAPEGIENNEIIYELLSDIAWSEKGFPLDSWLSSYCTNRYGSYPDAMRRAYGEFNASCFGSFTDHPRNKYQFRPKSRLKESVNTSERFGKGLELFLSCSDSCDTELYEIDVIEFTSQFLGIRVDELLREFQQTGEKDMDKLNDALQLLTELDRLLESHPNWRLKTWTDYAVKWGDTKEEKAYYKTNAKRLVTTWGGYINDYAAKTWSGLIREYYIPRWKLFYEAKCNNAEFDIKYWEENWIQSDVDTVVEPYEQPISKAKELFERYKN